ncbi:MAG: hypothetical protein U0893_19680 [Chloroflexota bacterium]
MRLLETVLGDDIFYCQGYDEAGCCRAIPCEFRGRRRLSVQRTHDFGLNVPRDISDVTYLILHRVPVAVALSERERYVTDELQACDGDASAEDQADHAVWLGQLAAYYVGFYERWIAVPPANSVVIDYAKLSEDPSVVIAQLFSQIGLSIDPGQTSKVIDRLSRLGGKYGEIPFVPRSITESRFYNSDLLQAYETVIIHHLPHLKTMRMFQPSDTQGSLIQSVFEARSGWQVGDVTAALAITESLVQGGCRNSLLICDYAMYLRALGRYDTAQAALKNLSPAPSRHPSCLRSLMTNSLTVGDLETARGAAMTLVSILGRDRAGALATGLSDRLGPPQGRMRNPVMTDSELADYNLRSLRDEVVVREVALRRAERQLQQLSVEILPQRGVIDDLVAELQKRERLIDDLAATAAARLDLIERISEDAERVRAEAEGLHRQVSEKQQALDDIAEAATRRLTALDEAQAEIVCLDQARQDLAASVASLRTQLDAKEEAISDLSAAAGERLRALEAASDEAAQLRRVRHDLTDHVKQLTEQLQEKEQVIQDLAVNARE